MHPRLPRWLAATLAAAALASIPVPSRAQAFRVAPTLPVPPSQYSDAAAVADFTGDGRDDVLVSYATAPGLSALALFASDGAGGFAAPVFSPGGGWSQAAVGDFNGDGRKDLVVANGGISLLTATASGQFETTVLMSAGEARGVATADVNGDGRLDVVATHQDELGVGHIVVWLGTASGGLTVPPTVDYFMVRDQRDIALGDLTGDGFPDAVFAAEDPTPRVVIAVNDQHGRFSPGPFLPLVEEPAGVALADLNGDGRLDIAASDPDGQALVVFLASAAGGFGTPVSYPGPGSVFLRGTVLARDFDGDARLDLLVSSAGVWLYKGDGAGGFGPPLRYGLQGVPATGDVNGDGRTDIVVGHSLMLNQGTLDFPAQRQFPSGAGTRAVAVADFDLDGRLDLVAANRASNDVAVLLGAGDGSFAAPRLAAAGVEPSDLAVADFNGDGRPDVAVANRGAGTVSILAGDGTGGLTPLSPLAVDSLPQAVAASDFDGDGRADLAVASAGASTVRVYLGSGAGGFTPGASYSMPAPPRALAVGFLNADNRPDIFVALNDSRAPQGTMLGVGAGTFLPPQGMGNGYVESAVFGDLDGDQALDLVTGGSGAVGIALGDGFGDFTSQLLPSPLEEALNIGPVAIGDFSRDGHLDVIAGGRKLALIMGDGTGRFGVFGGRFDVGGTAEGIATGDFDQDGHLDLAAALPDSDAVAILLERAAEPGADLSVAVAVAPEPAVPHSPLVFTLTVANAGPLAARNTVLRFTLPPGAPFVSSSPGAPVCAHDVSPSGQGLTCTLGDLAAGASSVVTVTTDVTQESAWLTSHPRVTADWPPDNDPLDNDFIVTTPVGAPIDVAVTLADSIDPVTPGAPFDYLVSVTNVGANPVVASPLTLVLPTELTAVSASLPVCAVFAHQVNCNFGGLAPGQGIPFTVQVLPATFTSVTSTVTVTASNDVDAANNTDTEETRGAPAVDRELQHGTELRTSFDPGADAHLYYLLQQPYASYEVLVDAVAGLASAPGQPIGLERLSVDLTPVQSSVPVGVGASRALRFERDDATGEVAAIRVTSTGCGTACGAGDQYRVRMRETTGRIARFNNTGTQLTILVLQNTGDTVVTGHLRLWNEAGEAVGSAPFTVGPRATARIDTVPLAPGRRGSVTVTHDGGYGGLAGKAVSLEPGTGFTFDTLMLPRAR